MLRIHERSVKRPQQLICGHLVEPGAEAYTVSMVVCGQDVARATQACVQGLRTLRQEPWRPSLLYRLWHLLWGNKQTQQVPGVSQAQATETNGQSQCLIAGQMLALDCGHTVRAGESYQLTTLSTCGQEGLWPLTVLLSCFRLRQQPSLVRSDGALAQ